MTTTPRAQTIIALAAITLVVVITLIAVATSGTDAPPDQIASASATAIVTPRLEQPRSSWEQLQTSEPIAADTSAPAPCPMLDERDPNDAAAVSLTPGLTFICDISGLAATPIADGRIVMMVDQAPLNAQKASLLADGDDGPWIRAAAYGTFVAIDHGSLNGAGNVTTIYAGLDSIDDDLALGQAVTPATQLGPLAGRIIDGNSLPGVLTFELLRDDTRFGSDPLRADPPPASAAATLAAQLGTWFELPVSTCSLPFGNLDLNVGAPRTYRSGTHNGLDFNCGTTDHDIVAAGAGDVLFVVDGYRDATPSDRDAVLANAALASDTPFWTLAMLYGNFVVVAHQPPNSTDRVVTIYAHLSSVDPNIVPGRRVEVGDRIGRVGNTGTSAAAQGITDTHSSVHLHWELHVNDRAIGYLGDPRDNEPLYQAMLCSPDTTVPGCAIVNDG